MIIEEILKKLEYRREPLERRISASQLGDDLLRIALSIKYGSLGNNFSQASIGSLIHKGLEHLFENSEKYEPEIDFEKELKGWSITGTADLLDKENEIIYDFKTTKYNTYKKLKEAINRGDYTHSYILQLNLLRYLSGSNYNLRLLFIFKDGGWNYKTKIEVPHYKELEVPTISNLEIENKLNEIIERLEPECEYDENGRLVDINVIAFHCNKSQYGYITTLSGYKKPAKCELYCSYKDVCPLYKTSEIDSFMEGW